MPWVGGQQAHGMASSAWRKRWLPWTAPGSLDDPFRTGFQAATSHKIDPRVPQRQTTEMVFSVPRAGRSVRRCWTGAQVDSFRPPAVPHRPSRQVRRPTAECGTARPLPAARQPARPTLHGGVAVEQDVAVARQAGHMAADVTQVDQDRARDAPRVKPGRRAGAHVDDERLAAAVDQGRSASRTAQKSCRMPTCSTRMSRPG